MSGAPFVGLRPFEEQDAGLFYGRDAQKDELLERLEKRRFVAVVGLSGSGKSSLVKAGLVPALFRGELDPAGSHWRIAIMQPSRNPLQTLAARLGTPDALEVLRSSSLGLAAWAGKYLDPGENLFVLADQFEEIFRDGEAEPTEEDLAFVRLLLEGAACAGSRLYVMLTIRADFLGHCGRFRGLPEALNVSQYLIPRHTRDQLSQLIEGPVQGAKAKIATGLVTKLKNDAGDDPTQLPALQHVLLRLWQISETDRAEGKEIGLNHYEDQRIGSLATAIDRHAEEIFARYKDDPGRRRAVRILFQRITGRKEGGLLARRKTPLKEIWDVTAETPDKAESNEHRKLVTGIIGDFRAEGVTFLTPREKETLEADSLIDISHETLMLRWSRLEKWMDEEAVSERRFRSISRDADDYEHGRASLYQAGASLATAEEWARTSPNEAWAERYGGNLARTLKFIRDSQAKVERRRKSSQIAGFLITLVLAGFATYVKVTGNNYKRQVAAALSRQLSAEAFDALQRTSGPELPGLLAIESLRRRPSPEAAAALGDSYRLLARRRLAINYKAGITACAFSPDGSRVAVGTSSGQIIVSSASTGKQIAELKFNGPVREFLFSQDGNWIAVKGVTDDAAIVEAASGKQTTFKGFAGFFEWGLAADGSRLTMVGMSPGNTLNVLTFDRASGVTKSVGSFKTFGAIAVSRNGSIVAFTSSRIVNVLRVDSAQAPATFPSEAGSLGLSADGGLLAASGGTGLKVFDISATPRQLWANDEITNSHVMEFSDDNHEFIVVSSGSRSAFDPRTGSFLWGSSVSVDPGLFSPNGRFFVATARDDVAGVFDASSDVELTRIGFEVPTRAGAISNRQLAVGTEDGGLQIFDLFRSDQWPFLSEEFLVNVSPDVKWLATGPMPSLTLLERKSGRTLPVTLSTYTAATAFTPDSSKFFWFDKGRIHIVDLATGKEIPADAPGAYAVFSLDGNRVAIVQSGAVDLFQVSPWKKLQTVPAGPGENRVVWSPNGRWVRIESYLPNGGISAAKVVSAETGEAAAVPVSFSWTVPTAFSADGRYLAAGGADGLTIYAIQPAPWAAVVHLAAGKKVTGVRFSPDSRLLAVEIQSSGAADDPAGRRISTEVYSVSGGQRLYSLDGTIRFSDQSRWDVPTFNSTRIYEAQTGKLATEMNLEGFSSAGFTDDDKAAWFVRGMPRLTIRQPIDQRMLIKETCALLPRNLSRQEWDAHLPGESCVATCPNLPNRCNEKPAAAK